MAMRGIDDDQVAAGGDQQLGALEALVADRRCGGDAQAALRRPCRRAGASRLLDVLDGDEADAAVVVIDDQQLLDAVLVQQPLALLPG